MDTIYYLTAFLIALGLPTLGIGIIAALIKPHLVNDRSIIKNPMSRGKIAKVGATAFIVSFISLGMVAGATEPASVKAERAERQASEAASLRLKQQQAAEAKEKTAEEARLREEEANKPVTKTETKTESVAFESVERNDNSIAQGEKRLSVTGVNGERTITYEVVYVRGKETTRKEIKNEITAQPITQVTLNGTYVKPAPAPAPTPAYSNSGGVVKMSNSSICHAPGTTYYSRTTNYTPYDSLSACLAAGGRMPKR